MWLDDDTIARLLRTADPDAVARGLAAFAERDADCDPPALEAPAADVMSVFSGGIPQAALDHFMALVVSVASDVGLPAESAGARLGEVIARGGDRRNGYEAALALKSRYEPEAAARAAVERVGEVLDDLDPDRRPAIAYFVSCLLDGRPPVRDAVFDALTRWRATPASRDTLGVLAGHVGADDRARLPR